MRKFICSLLVCTLYLGACTDDDNAILPEPLMEQDSLPSVRYLALGDSYTIGESVAEEDRFPIQLADRLTSDSIAATETLIIARTGWRTDNLQQGIDDAGIEQDTFGLVTLLIGVNNQFQGKPISVYETEFSSLLQQAIDFAGGRKERVFVLSIPDYAFTPFGQAFGDPNQTSQQIDAFNAVNQRITKDRGIQWFDITPISRRGLEEPELVASDGLHPSGAMYALWVDTMYQAVVAILQ